MHSVSGKVLTFCSLPWIFWFLIPVPPTLLKSSEQPAGNGLRKLWNPTTTGPQATSITLLHTRCFEWCCLLIHLLSPKPKCSYYSRLNASATTGINRKSFLSFNGCRTMHPLCSDALENYMCAEVRNNRWESAYISRKSIIDNLEKVNSGRVLGNPGIWAAEREKQASF